MKCPFKPTVTTNSSNSNTNDILHIVIKDSADFIDYINRYLSE